MTATTVIGSIATFKRVAVSLNVVNVPKDDGYAIYLYFWISVTKAYVFAAVLDSSDARSEFIPLLLSDVLASSP